MMNAHKERTHSKFSASGASRWFSCSGSVTLSEGIPSKDSKYSLEGTRAHEVLEALLLQKKHAPGVPPDMLEFARRTADFVRSVHNKTEQANLLVETRVKLDFIHPEAFGTLDVAIPELFGTLHVLDFKYGKSPVSPRENLQFLFYALALGHEYDWNFARVRMWTLQPRTDDGYSFWEISITELKQYIKKFRDAVKRVEEYPTTYKEGGHCHFCPAKGKCPLKQNGRLDKAISLFKSTPIK